MLTADEPSDNSFLYMTLMEDLIKWNQYISNQEVLTTAGVEDQLRPYCMVNWTTENILLFVQNYHIKTHANLCALKCGDVIKE